MTLTVSQWPFLPQEQQTPEQYTQWRETCYIPSPAEVTLRGIAHTVIISGGPGSGKSTALATLDELKEGQPFTVRYPLIHWPGETHAWIRGFGHLGQIMACTAIKLSRYLKEHPEQINNLSEINLEYLRWLIEKHSGSRAFRRWADVINKPELLNLLQEPFDDLYPTDTELQDVQGQIEELITLSLRLGFNGVAVLIDLHHNDPLTDERLQNIKDLFGWLTPLQFEGFALKAALPSHVIEQTNLLELTRGRASFAPLNWSNETCRQIANRCLTAATGGQLTDLTQLASDELLTQLETKLKIIFNGHAPQAWVWLTATLLPLYTQKEAKLSIKYSNDLLHNYFANYIPLRMDKRHQGVWRGGEFIPLEEQPFRFLETLWRFSPDMEATEALLEVAGRSQGNLNTIASRLRKKIEPLSGKPIYLYNTRSRGYWLENIVR